MYAFLLRITARMGAFLMRGNIVYVTLVIVLASFAWGILGAYIIRAVYRGDVPELGFSINLVIMSLIAGSAGFVQIIRKEAPGVGINAPIKGIPAVISGALIIALFWGLGLLTLLLSLGGG